MTKKSVCGVTADYCTRIKPQCIPGPSADISKQSFAVSIVSSLYQKSCKLHFTETDRKKSVLTSDLSCGKGGLNTERLDETSGGCAGLVMLYARFISLGVESSVPQVYH